MSAGRPTRTAGGPEQATATFAPEEALELAELVLRLAEAEGATEAEILVATGDEALTRFANSEIHQNVSERDVRINLRFVRGKRIGVASSGRTDGDALRRLARNAGRIAAVAEETPDWAGLPGARPVEPVAGAFAAGTAEASPELRADGVRAVVDAADRAGVTAFGSFSTGVETVALATTRGIRAAESRTSARLLVVTMGPRRRHGLRGCGVGRRHPDRRGGRRQRGRREGAPLCPARRPAARRLPRRAGGVRRHGPAGQPGLHRLLGPRGAGGPFVLRAGEGGSGASSSRSSTTRVTRPGCRPRSTTKASRRAGS